jgi:hypothetical protein
MCASFLFMSSIAEIEAAIKHLPDPQVDQLAQWLQAFRQQRNAPSSVESWLRRARGAAVPGTRTDDIIAATRGEQ